MCIVFCATCFFYSCAGTSVKENRKDDLASFAQAADSVFQNSKAPAAYVLLPNAGCGGCISSAEQLFEEYVKKEKPVKFILTNISSFKAFRNTFGDSVVLHPMVYADKENFFYTKLPSDVYKIYPILFYLDSLGAVSSYEYVNPDNPGALDKFRSFVDSQKR